MKMYPVLAALLSTAIAALASADTGSLGGYPLNPVIGGPVDGHNAPDFHWTLKSTLDQGIEAGTVITFDAYSVDLTQTIATGPNNLFDVIAPRGLSGRQSLLLTTLWTVYQGDINTPNDAAAFQLAVWEIIYDTDFNISSGLFRISGTGHLTGTAQAWIDTVNASGAGDQGPGMYSMELPGMEGQFTAIPTPGTAALALLGSVSLMGRRRR